MLKKKDLVRRVSRSLGETQRVVEGIIDTTLEEIVNMLLEGNELHLNGFGKFYTKTTNEVTRPTPTGTMVTIPERTRPQFYFFDSVKNVF